MDIDYLLFLQHFRESINDALTPFMEFVSLFAISFLITIPAFIYWCKDKRIGLYALSAYALSSAITVIVKLTACVYRPWIRDSRIIPAGDSVRSATGYSFPSGHTSNAASIYGGLALKSPKKRRWIKVICVLMILLTAFSRNYLGVHTPQDVLTAILLGTIAVLFMSKLSSYLSKHTEKENIVLAAGIVFCIASLIYISAKPYPRDIVNGKLLVDPKAMMKDGFGCIGRLTALCAARYAEKKWVRYSPSLSPKTVVLGIAGSFITVLIITFGIFPLKALFGLHWGAFAKNFIMMTFIILIWPAVMKQRTKDKI
ncbi:PAP2 superfamily protein [Ruminococcus flavefaciens]|uniref:PAP2 superfamily protein n=1 Tax=Ruminococcus flavefaciens TaxID=1265 RepID=A0A1H6J1F0_RUMFL|nr:phosphatase PAP2 family protein [Ruminococcus flavefaciens]SEH52675.1 PAP2 superfamily protein [Ruminococcus flavefaciens]